MAEQEPHICIVFDGPPGPESGRFVEVETSDGKSIRLGTWRQRSDGLWSLDLPVVPASMAEGLVDASVDDTGGTGAADAAILAASKDLAASVAHHAARADEAEAEAAGMAVRVRRTKEIADDVLQAMRVERDAAVVRAEAAEASDRQAGETCADLRRQLLTVTAERDRLARVLAVERGDQTQAPEGWLGDHGVWWRNRERGSPLRVLRRPKTDCRPVTCWESPGDERTWPTALRAMEALDAATGRLAMAVDAEVSDE